MSAVVGWKPYIQNIHKGIILELLQFINQNTDALIAASNMCLELHYGSARFSQDLYLDTTDEDLDITSILERYCRLKYNFLKLKNATRTKKSRCYYFSYELSEQGEIYFYAGFEIIVNITKPNPKMTTEIVNGCRTYDIPMLVRILDDRCKSVNNLQTLNDLYFFCRKLKLAGRNVELSRLVGRLWRYHDCIWELERMISRNLDPYIDCHNLLCSFNLIPYEFEGVPDYYKLNSQPCDENLRLH